MQELTARLRELLANGSAVRILGWKKGDFDNNPEPHFFETAEALEDFVYDDYCAMNLSKYMIEASKMEGVTAVCLKPCDSYSFNQLIKEHRVDRSKAYIIGVGCKGKKGYDGERLERCHVCKGKEHRIYDELIGESEDTVDRERMAEVERIEAMSAADRFAFFQSELSKCIRCNACRNVCPACSCRHCVFDNSKFDSEQKANVDSFEEKMFHIIRAFHVAGRCTDCGECSRVCPQGIPLHLFNRKFIKDINEFYGDFQAGYDAESRGPLTDFKEGDVEPSIVSDRN